jgi:hypothetical protein
VDAVRPGQLVAHHEVISLPLWSSLLLSHVVGRAPRGEPLLVVEVAERPRIGEEAPVVWARVVSGGAEGWLPTPTRRLTVMDEQEDPVQISSN